MDICKMEYKEGVINFNFNTFLRKLDCCLPDTKTYYTLYEESCAGNYILKMEKEKLKGERNLTKRYSAYTAGVKNGKEDMRKTTDCTGDCGNNKVYFVKQ
jgi:hypothetical protein